MRNLFSTKVKVLVVLAILLSVALAIASGVSSGNLPFGKGQAGVLSSVSSASILPNDRLSNISK